MDQKEFASSFMESVFLTSDSLNNHSIVFL